MKRYDISDLLQNNPVAGWRLEVAGAIDETRFSK